MVDLKRLLPPLCWSAAALVVLKKLSFPLYDPDLWWHLAWGREIVQTLSLPRTEFFYHTAFGVPWVNFEWLAEALLFIGWKWGGLPLLYAGKILASFAVLGALVWALRRAGARGALLFLLGWGGFFLLRHRLFERLELISLFSFCLVVGTLLSEGSFTKRLWFLGVLQVFWINMHAGSLFSPVVAFLLAVGARWSGAPAERTRFLERAFVLLLAAVLANPYGPRIVLPTVETLFYLRQAPGLVEEWKALSFAERPLFPALLLASVAMWTWAMKNGERRARFWAGALFFFAAWGMGSVRSGTYFAVVALVAIADLSRERAWARSPWAWAAAVVAVLVHLPVLGRPFPKGLLLPTHDPDKSCRFIRENGVDGRMYNAYALGGYLEWSLGPARKVFMDGRGDLSLPFLMEEAEMVRCLPASDRSGAWKKYLDRYGVDHAVLDYRHAWPLRLPGREGVFQVSLWEKLFPRKEWALVQWDDAALVLLKRVPRFDALIRRHEYKLLWPHQQDLMADLLASGEVSGEALRKELERHARENGFSVRAEALKKL